MKKYFIIVFLTFIGLGAYPESVLLAASPPSPVMPPVLAIAQIKIVGDEFIILQNNTSKDINDLSNYWLDYFNSYSPLDAGVSSSSQQLPAVKLASKQTLLLSSNGMTTCGAVAVGKLSVSLADGAGFLQVVQTSLGALGVSRLPVDSVSWSSGANGVIQSVPSATKDPKGMYYRYAGSNGYAWQLADLDATVPCQLDVSVGGNVNTYNVALASSSVPSINGVSSSSNSGLPQSDVGLVAPQLSEILPNPAPPKTDADDEFIELYNSNVKPFDLSGLIIQVGTTTTHKYTLPDGTTLQPGQFQAFYATETDLSLSNTSGQVKLLDPSGNVLEQSDIYQSAKDNYAWVFANGLWQWTTTPTPDAKNVITSPPGQSSKSSSASGSTSKAVVLATKTSGSTGSSSGGTQASASPVHPLILAGIGAAALLYALYEYRHDLANAFHRLGRNRKARGANGTAAETATNYRTSF